MFQGALQSRDETVVIEDPDAPRSVQQQLAEEVVPHVIIATDDGRRHKLTPDRTAASCGTEYHAGFDVLVPEGLTGKLCEKGCFPPFELEKAAAIAARERHDIETMRTPKQWLDTQEVLATARIDRNRNRKKK